jgi:hypothetical protein
MQQNIGVLQIKESRLKSRMADLRNYKEKIMQNFTELEHGIRKYLSAQASSAAAPKPE